MKDKILAYIKKNKFALILTLVYGIFIIILSSFHEVWRDEVRALNYAMEANSLWDLFKNIQNEGHPALWYVLLYFGYNVFHSTIILKVLNILISVIAIYIFLTYSPFTLAQKILFIFGYFPLYQFAVINRSYALIMLFLFLFCALYPLRFRNFIPLGIILFLLANTHIIGTIFSSLFFLFIILEHIFNKNKETQGRANSHIMAAGIIIILGILSSILLSFPVDDVSFTNLYHVDIKSILSPVVGVLLNPGEYLSRILGFENIIIANIFVWFSIVYLFFRKKSLFFCFLVGILGINFFFNILYYPDQRHLGLVYIFVVSIFWIDGSGDGIYYGKREMLLPFRLLYDNILKYKEGVILLLLLLQISAVIIPIKDEITRDFSSSKKLSTIIRQNNLENAIIVGEPDFMVEPLLYYINNPVFIARENRFGKTVSWVIKKNNTLSIENLYTTSLELNKRYGQPVVIVITHKLEENSEHEINYYGRKFIYTNDSLKNFFSHVTKIASLGDSIVYENYDAYLIKQ